MIDDRFDSADLSEAGVQRREEILRSAVRAASRRRRRGQFLRVGAPLAAVVLAAFLAARFGSVQQSPRAQTKPPEVATVPPPPAAAPVTPPAVPGVTITRIQTDPTLLDRLSVPPRKRDWQVLNDEQLLQALAAAGRPAGLQYARDGQVSLLYREPDN